MAWPDATGLVIAYLGPVVAPVAVAARVPQQSAPREPLVQVRRAGGPALPPVRDRARLDIWTWQTTDDLAMDLALQVRAAVWALSGTTLLGGVTCYRVGEFLGPRHADDPESTTPRVWATYELDLRADQVIQPAPTIWP
ncbi:hypothetical protein [Streptomyces aidingensis]|uniref:Tail terminator n=1 Tax=Streptomyces aidingensis TaxID=910347 RepID=A0A1I1Q8J1_9ACTN|nr:hypothetical protein [Streptomyces aidingensis]SFD14430.1 hypothetical protein SAMN05421773_110116 [Streptomyces aidingensis]